MADLKLHLRTLIPTIALALEEVPKKLLLNRDSVVRVKMRPVFQAVSFEPSVFRGGAHKAFEIAARMQPLPAPIRRRQERHFHFVPLRRTRLVIVVIQRMGKDRVSELGAIGGQLRRREKVSSPHTSSPVTTLRGPRSPSPYCTLLTCTSYQAAQKVERMPP